jgi:pimeloyl-ACP methyl ester carboxylesterase
MEQTTAGQARIGEHEPENGCNQPCHFGSLSPPAVCLDEALRRFEQEAAHGVCPTGRYRCPFFIWGSGPPLVFIHGLGDLACSYVPVISVLAREFRCIGYEQPTGRGDGARLRCYKHADLMEDLFALLDHLGIKQSYLFGSSFGSTIALAAMRARPERIPRAILAGGFAQRLLSPAERCLAWLTRFAPVSMRSIPLRKTVLKQCLGPRCMNRPEIFEFMLGNTGTLPIAAVAQRALLLRKLDLRSLLPEIRQPVLLLCGEYDAVVDRRCEDVLLQGLPNSARAELQDCGHMAHYTHPELVAELVRRFLTPLK